MFFLPIYFTQTLCHSPTRLIAMVRRRKPRPVHRRRSPTTPPIRRSRGRSMSRSKSRGRRSSSSGTSRSRSRTRYHRCISPGLSPRRGHSPRRVMRHRSPLRRSRGSITASEPPQYPFHPNETVMISNDVTSISFIMDGRCSIPGDGKLHRVTIAILPFTATIHHVITPRVSFDAYLQVGPLDFRPC